MKIATDESASWNFEAHITSHVSDYLNFNSESVEWAAPVQGSGTHDCMSGELNKGLQSWRDLISSDAQAISKANDAMREVDEEVKAKLIGALE